MKLEGNEGNFIIVGKNHSLYVNSDFANATKFEISISVSGGICLSVSMGLYVRIDSNDNSIKAESVDNYGASTIFEISLIKTESYELKYRISVQLSECDMAWASFIWSLTGGFFLAIGLGPFILTGEANPGVLALIRTSPNAWAAVQRLVNVIVTGKKKNIKLAIAASLGVIGTFYHEGLLWTLFKIMLRFGGWFALGWALGKIIAFVFIPEVEAAELLASFAVWASQTVQSGLDVGQVCTS